MDSKTVCRISTDSKNAIWLKLKKEHFNEPEDIYIGTFYLSPNSYKKKTKSNYIVELESEIFKFSSKGKVIIQGDFNSRCGKLQDVVLQNRHFDNNDVTNFSTSSDPKIPPKNSADMKNNERGRKLIELCIMSDFYIVNGRKLGGLPGQKTCFRWDGSSQIDLVICSSSIFWEIQYLKISKLIPWLSHHCLVTFSLKVDNVVNSHIPKSNLHKLPGSLIWDNDSKLRYKKALQSDVISDVIENLSNNIENYSVDESFLKITNILNHAADSSKIKKHQSRSGNFSFKNNRPWFDKECEVEKHNLELLAKMVQKHPTNKNLRENLNQMKREFKN